jgi:hypothetical protein
MLAFQRCFPGTMLAHLTLSLLAWKNSQCTKNNPRKTVNDASEPELGKKRQRTAKLKKDSDEIPKGKIQ